MTDRTIETSVQSSRTRTSTGGSTGTATARQELQTTEMRVLLREELDDLSRHLNALQTALDDAAETPPASRRARARASLLAILERMS